MASRKDVEAGKAHILLYLKDHFNKPFKKFSEELKKNGIVFERAIGLQALRSGAIRGLNTMAEKAKAMASSFKQVAEPLNQLSSIAGQAGAALLGPLVAAVTQLDEAKQPLEDIKKSLAEALGRPLLPFLNSIRDVVVRFSEWAKQNPRIIQSIALIGAGLLGVALAAKIVASGFMLIAGAATIASVASSALALLLSPAGLIVAGISLVGAGIVAAAVAWVKFTDSGKNAFSSLMAVVKPFVDTIRSAFNGIVDAFSAGRLELAWKITVTSMKLLFFQMVQAVMDKFIDLVEFITNNDFVRFVLGDALAGIGAGARGASASTIAKIKKDLDDLNRAAARAAAKAAKGFGGGALAPDAALANSRKEHPSQVAQTTHQAIALTFGNEPRNSRGLTKAQLDELKQIRKLSVAHHKDLIATLRRSGTLRFSK